MMSATKATETTRRRIDSAGENLPLHDSQDFADAERGFIARSDERHIRDANGRAVWDLDAYEFLAAAVPVTANPSLWRQGNCALRIRPPHTLYDIQTIRGAPVRDA